MKLKLNRQMLDADPQARQFLIAIEDYTQAFNAFQAVRIYGIAEDNQVYVAAKEKLAETMALLVESVFPQYVIKE